MPGSVLGFETRRMLRNFPPMFFGLLFPVLILAIFGGIYGNQPSDQFGGQGTVDVSVPAYVAMVLTVAGLMSFPLGMVEYRSRGFLKRLRATPVRPGSVLAAQVVVNGAVCLVGITLLIGVAAIGYDLRAPAYPVQFGALVVFCGAAAFSLGLLIAAVARSESSALVIAMLVFYPMIFLTGATIPREIMPGVMQGISDALPMSYAVRALQWAWLDRGGAELPLALLVLGGTILVSTAVAARLFRWE